MLGRPKTPEAYVDLVDQALFEIEDLRMAAEYDMESMGAATEFLAELERDVRKLSDSMADGSYRFGKENLPFLQGRRAPGRTDSAFSAITFENQRDPSQGSGCRG